MTTYDPLEDARTKQDQEKANQAETERKAKSDGRSQQSQEQELSLVFLRQEQKQAQEQFELAANRYAKSNSAKDKKAYEQAKIKYNQTTAALKIVGVEVDPKTGYQKPTQPKYTDRPSNPIGNNRGFDPTFNYGLAGADNPAERAKSAITGESPAYVFPNTLDNSRWNPNSFIDTEEDSLSKMYSGGSYLEPTAVAFIANENGSIYQNGAGDPIDLVSYVNKVIAEYSNAGKMNELRSLLSKVTVDPFELASLDKAKSMPGSDYSGADYYTRTLVKRAVQFTTISNIFVSGMPKDRPKFANLQGYLESYKGELNYYIGGGSGSGSGTPRKTTSITRNVYTPEDLELNIDQFFQAYTGQGATKEDVEYLTKRLNEADPQKTVTTNNGNTSTSVITGGVSGQEEQTMMREMALKDPNAEGYNKATAYLSYFEKALRAPIELGA